VETYGGWSSAVLDTCSAEDCELAGWFLTPNHHLMEGLLTNLLLILMVIRTWPPKGVKPSQWWPRNDGKRTPLDWFLLIATICSLSMVVYHKSQEGRLWFLLQPCHTLQALMIVTMMLGSQSRLAVLLFNLYLNMFFSPFLGMVAADLSVYSQWMELESWAVQHALLCLLPFFFIATRRFPVINSGRFMVFAFTLEMFFHFGVLLPLSIFSGFNLNYMMCPPNGPLTSFGLYYRPVMSVACLGMAFVLKNLVFNPFTRFCSIDMYPTLPFIVKPSPHTTTHKKD